MLTLPIKRKCKWFNMILSGEKKEEYREMLWKKFPLVCCKVYAVS